MPHSRIIPNIATDPVSKDYSPELNIGYAKLMEMYIRNIFSRLIRETRGYKGNAVMNQYKAENGDGVAPDRLHELNCGGRIVQNRFSAADDGMARIAGPGGEAAGFMV